MKSHKDGADKFYDKPASIGDVIGWACLIPAIGFVVPVFTNEFKFISHFDNMFKSLGAKLPVLTQVVLMIGDPWIQLIPITMIMVGTAFLIMASSAFTKMLVGISILLGTIVYFKLLVMAIFGPILELQKQLS